MKKFRADLHIHSVLSPCGDLEMSPDVIIANAKEKHLDIIGITDHNSTRQCQVISRMGADNGIVVLCGAEVTTREEVHCLVFFESVAQLNDFQEYLDLHLPDIQNDVNRFGCQVVVDAGNDIVFTENRLLISALDQSISQIEKKVHSLNGLFIPAHIDRSRFGLLAQLGFFPEGLNVDALEISPRTSRDDFFRNHKELNNHALIGGSDAHLPHMIGSRTTTFEMETPAFSQIKKILNENPAGLIEISA